MRRIFSAGYAAARVLPAHMIFCCNTLVVNGIVVDLKLVRVFEV
jgi:hypothetical protein